MIAYLQSIPDHILRVAVSSAAGIIIFCCVADFLIQEIFFQIQKAIEKDLKDLDIDIRAGP